jgi:hypothetical protein
VNGCNYSAVVREKRATIDLRERLITTNNIAAREQDASTIDLEILAN